MLRHTPFHEGSHEAVRILEAARRQDKFEQVLDALFAKQPDWAIHGAPDLNRAWRIAGAVGLDLERARTDRLHPDTTAILDRDVADLQTMGVRATPTFSLDGRPLRNVSFDSLSAAIRTAVAEPG
ncbi:DsbA family protein [Paracoccus rhizosphaerae]|uniref:DsbA family protein n=1 Tax=Paracoccus rhizosphaerae TaxID=1133347 RepID=A0ABV6CJ52_9RHOB|nr:thioredoxin domain-containing protein [Paracoccus rhizosphaerae]